MQPPQNLKIIRLGAEDCHDVDDEPRLIHYLGREFGRCGRGQRPERESARKRAPLTNSDAAILSLVAAAAAALSLRLVDDDDKEKRGERGEREKEGGRDAVRRKRSITSRGGRKEGRKERTETDCMAKDGWSQWQLGWLAAGQTAAGLLSSSIEVLNSSI